MLVGGIPTPLKKYEFVSWDDDIPNWMEKNMFQTTKQYRILPANADFLALPCLIIRG